MHWEFVTAGYIIVLSGLALYTAWVVHRGRQLSRQVPQGRRRYFDVAD